MSGTEVIGAATTIAGLVKTGWEVYQFCRDVIDAPKAMSKLLVEIKDFNNTLDWLARHIDTLDDSDPAMLQLSTLLVKDERGGKLEYGPLLEQTIELYRDAQKAVRIPVINDDDSKIRKGFVMVKRGVTYTAWRLSQSDTEQMMRKFNDLRGDIDHCITRAGFDTQRSLRRELHIGQETLQANQTKTQQSIHTLNISHSALIDAASSQSEALGKMTHEWHELNAARHMKDFRKLLEWVHPWKSYYPTTSKLDTVLMSAEWLFKEEPFAEVCNAWCEGAKWDLQIWGQAGHGKTMLCSSLATLLSRRFSTSSKTPVLSLYLKMEDQSYQSPQQLLSSLLKQLLAYSQRECVPLELEKLWTAPKRGPNLPTEHSFELLKSMLSRQERTYIIVDGLDEADRLVRQTLHDNLAQLKTFANLSILYTLRPLAVDPEPLLISCDMCGRKPLKVHYFSSSRRRSFPKCTLCQTCAKAPSKCPSASDDLYEPYDIIVLPLVVPEVVIKNFISHLLEREKKIGLNPSDLAISDRKSGYTQTTVNRTILGLVLDDLRARGSDLEKSIVSTIVSSAGGCFLLARMQWSSVQLSASPKDIRKALGRLPKEFNEVYDDATKRILDQRSNDAQIGKRIIAWLARSERVLGLSELQHALAVDLDAFVDQLNGEKGIKDEDIFAKDSVVQENVIAVTTAGLVTVAQDRSVRLMHRSAYEYFQQDHVQKKLLGNTDADIALSCIAYLSHTAANTPCAGENDDQEIETKLTELPFAAYASQHWGGHVVKSQSSEIVQKAVKQFLCDPSMLASAVQISEAHQHLDSSGWDIRKGVAALHVISWFGLYHLLEESARPCENIDTPDNSGHARTPLIHACRGGNGDTVARLLELNASPSIADRYGLTPLGHAVKLHRHEAVSVLCRHSSAAINVGVDQDGKTALMLALCNNPHIPTIEALLDIKSIDINARGPSEFTALMYAATIENLDALRLILAHPDINLNLISEAKCTALHYAVVCNRLENVRELLARGADPSVGAGGKGAPLLLAADAGHKDIIEIFFERFNQSPFTHESTRNDRHEGLLQYAVRQELVEVVERLLGHGFDVNVQDADGTSALHVASQMNLPTMTKLLLNHDADPKLRNVMNQTPADIARLHGRTALVKLLNPGTDETLEAIAEEDRPLYVMSSCGMTDAIKAALIRNPSRALDGDLVDGNTALHIAVLNRDYPTVEAILHHTDAIDVTNKPNRLGRTPLHDACYISANGIIELLLSHNPPPNLDMHTPNQETALQFVIESGNEPAIVSLIKAGAQLPRIDKIPGYVFEAVIKGDCITSAQRLIDAGIEVKREHRMLARETGASADLRRLLTKYKTLKFEPKVLRNGSTVSHEHSEATSVDAVATTLAVTTVIETEDDVDLSVQRSRETIMVTTSEITTDRPDDEQVSATDAETSGPDLDLDPFALPDAPTNAPSLPWLPEVPITAVPEPLPSLSPIKTEFQTLLQQDELAERLLEAPLLA